MNLFALLVLLAMALWLSRGALKSVGIFRVSRAVNRDAALHECDDPDCPATTLFSAIEDTHRKVRAEAVVAVVTLVAVACTFVFFMGRLV